MIQKVIDLAEKRVLPDWLVRKGIDSLLQYRRISESKRSSSIEDFVKELKASPIALQVDKANEQHYEVPAKFFELCLGSRLKYSCCYFENEKSTLDEAEIASLDQVCKRAGIEDGMEILDLGCGWGSFSLYAAEQFPASKILSVSNSSTQKEFIDSKGFANVQVVTSDINDFQTERKFDRVVSIEAFEHMRNYQLLLRNISSWLKVDGRCFVHIFCHKTSPYLFETKDASDWMGKYFFSGGMMPSDDLLSHFQDDMKLEEKWKVNGNHYSKTLEAWLDKLDDCEDEVMKLFEKDLNRKEAALNIARWRMFFMACSELFNFRNGNEWWVSHYLFSKK